MPLWLSLGEMLIKALVWWYGHQEVVNRAAKYTPLPPDPLPTPRSRREPKQPWLHSGDNILDLSK